MPQDKIQSHLKCRPAEQMDLNAEMLITTINRNAKFIQQSGKVTLRQVQQSFHNATQRKQIT